MKVLLLHNRYQLPGGEDAVVRAESELLRSNSHDVRLCEWSNDAIKGVRSKLRAAVAAVYSRASRRCVAEELAQFRPDVVHIHNFSPLLSPSAYFACAEAGVPIVQTLHNYRLLCPSADLFRDGKVCEDCLGKSVPWPGVLHACYRGSRVGTVPVAAMLATHRAMGTFERKVDAYIALTEFSRRKFVQGGLPAEKIFVKPNFLLRDPGAKTDEGEYVIFVGRFTEQKGVGTLVSALAKVSHIPAVLVGDGALHAEIAAGIAASNLKHIRLAGWLPPAKVRELMRSARFLIMASQSYENFPLIVVEAFAMGLPVVCPRLGAMKEIVDDRLTGLHFEPGDPSRLAEEVRWAWEHRAEMQQMGRAARAEYEAKYTAERNCQQLMAIYSHVTRTNSSVSGELVATGAS